jgi:hypothetical protein
LFGGSHHEGKKSMDFYSRKLNTAQKWYTSTEREQELLSAIQACKEYKNILFCYIQTIFVFTDHKNYIFNGLKENNSDRVLCWNLLLEEYGVPFEYLPTQKSMGSVANSLYRLDIHGLSIQE